MWRHAQLLESAPLAWQLTVAKQVSCTEWSDMLYRKCNRQVNHLHVLWFTMAKGKTCEGWKMSSQVYQWVTFACMHAIFESLHCAINKWCGKMPGGWSALWLVKSIPCTASQRTSYIFIFIQQNNFKKKIQSASDIRRQCADLGFVTIEFPSLFSPTTVYQSVHGVTSYNVTSYNVFLY